jgi:hypothetical protein
MKKETFTGYELKEYPDIKNVNFPHEIHIAYAVCGKSCGNREFIVDGSSQVCQYCGKLMYRTKVKKYQLSNK